MSLVKKLALPVGLLLAGIIGSSVSHHFYKKMSEQTDIYNIPAVERVLEIEEEFKSLNQNRELSAENSGYHIDLILEYGDSLRTPNIIENVSRYRSKEMMKDFWDNLFDINLVLGGFGGLLGINEMFKYRKQKKHSQKA